MIRSVWLPFGFYTQHRQVPCPWVLYCCNNHSTAVKNKLRHDTAVFNGQRLVLSFSRVKTFSLQSNTGTTAAAVPDNPPFTLSPVPNNSALVPRTYRTYRIYGTAEHVPTDKLRDCLLIDKLARGGNDGIQ